VGEEFALCFTSANESWKNLSATVNPFAEFSTALRELSGVDFLQEGGARESTTSQVESEAYQSVELVLVDAGLDMTANA
jgi:hypothetical protein